MIEFMKRYTIVALLVIGLWLSPLHLSAGAAPPPPKTPTEGLKSSLERAILKEISLQREIVPAYALFNIQIETQGVSQDNSWAIAHLISLDPATGFTIQTEPGLAIAQNYIDGWQITLPNEPGWLDALITVPDTLLTIEDKITWLAMYNQQASPLSAVEFSGYKLPWEAGKKLVLTQSISHYNPPNPSGSMHYSFDFAAWHDSSGTSPMFAVHASKGGRVKWARWIQENGDAASPGNYLVIEDLTTTPATFALYLHLAKDSIPTGFRQAGANVSQGQYIGMADDTGYSTGNHLHFQVHTNPSSYWGNSVDITFSDVAINGGRPRTPTEAANWPQYGSQGQLEYTSGNSIPGDSIPPSGGLYTPADKLRIQGSSTLISGWAQDNIAMGSIQIKANFSGAWYNVGPAFSSSPFSYNWDMCADNVPDGPVTLMLELQDANGNFARGTPGLRRLVKQYHCPVPMPVCIPNSNQVTLFSDPGFQGKCTIFGVGTYSSSALGNVGDDNAESVLVGSQVWATLFNGNQQGRGKTFQLQDRNLNDDRIGANRVSSLLVRSITTSASSPRMVYPSDNTTFPANSSLSLSWDDLGGGIEFQVKFDNADKTWQKDTYFHLGSVSSGNHTWQVRARNSNGTSSWSSQRTFYIADPLNLPEEPTVTAPFIDTMETGYNGWLRGEWDQTVEQNHTPGGSISFNYEINDRIPDYDTGAPNSGYLTSPEITIPSTGYALSFWYLYETEGPGVHWDQRWVQISVDGGPFTNILQLHSDPPNYWLQSAPIDLSEYSGHGIQIRFHFATMDAISNGYRGWYIDDFSIDTYVPQVCSDSNEPDGSQSQAKSITYNTTVSREICPRGDMDYFKFSGVQGATVGVRSRATVTHQPDSYIFLLDDDFSTILAENDDMIPGIVTDSHLSYRLPRNGEYYIKLRAWDHPSAGGSDFDYELSLFGNDNTSPIANIFYPRANTPYPDGAILIQVDAQDIPTHGEVSTGISHVEFFWHPGDWVGTNWMSLGTDWVSSDGWGYNFDTTSLPDERLIAVYVRVYDWAGNWRDVILWDLCLGTAACNWHLPLLNR